MEELFCQLLEPSNDAEKKQKLSFNFSENFDVGIWRQISKLTPMHFRKLNNSIFSQLMRNQTLFKKYFSIFYNNHARLYHWFLLSKKDHCELKEYLCEPLLKKSVTEYQDQMMSNLFIDKQRERKKKMISKRSQNSHEKKMNSSSQNIRNDESGLEQGHGQSTTIPKSDHYNKNNVTFLKTEENQKLPNSHYNQQVKHSFLCEKNQQTQNFANQLFNYFSKSTHTASSKKKIYKGYMNMNMGDKGKKKEEQGHKSPKKSTVRSQEDVPIEEKGNLKLEKVDNETKRRPTGDGESSLKNSQTVVLPDTINSFQCTKNSKIPKIVQSSQISSRINIEEQGKPLQRSLNRNHDFHELYLKTFQACDGQKYIFYNFQKHMKGMSERQKYNSFIRQNKQKNPRNLLTSIRSKTNEKPTKIQTENLKCTCKSSQFFQSAHFHSKNLGSDDWAIQTMKEKRQNSENLKDNLSKTMGKSFGMSKQNKESVQKGILHGFEITEGTFHERRTNISYLDSISKTMQHSDSCKIRMLNYSENPFGCGNLNHRHELKVIKNSQRSCCTAKSNYEFSPVGNIGVKASCSRSKMIFRRMRTRNNGKFIRK